VKDICNLLGENIDSLKDIRFYLLLDDFFPPFLSFEQQKVILELVRERKGPLSFKFATLPEGMTFVTDSGYEMRPTLDYTPQFLEYKDVGSGSDYWRTVKDITNLRLKSYALTYKDLFEKPNQSAQDFLKRLKGKVSKGHDLPIYAGFNMIVEMSSGIIGEYIHLVREMINSVLSSKNEYQFSKNDIPIPAGIQDNVIRRRSANFLGSIGSLEDGLRINKLVVKMQKEARERFINNLTAKEHIQYNIKDYENLEKGAHNSLIIAFRNNILQSPSESYPTQRQQRVILRTLILNRLLTPVLRIPYRDRWRIDIEAKEINHILLSEADEPIPLTEDPPVTTPITKKPIQLVLSTPENSLFQPIIKQTLCNVFSGNCQKISELQRVEEGGFLALPFNEDWHKYTEEFIKKAFKDTITSLDIYPNGDFTCKICEYIHKKRFGVYEITKLNDNVILEMGLSLGIGKHTFPIWNKEEVEAKWWQQNSSVSYLIGGLEGISYMVTQDSINKDVKNKIEKSLNELSWNRDLIDKDNHISNGKRKDNIFLAMPTCSPYYQMTLKGEVLKAFEEIGCKDRILKLPDIFEEGLNFVNSFKWICQSNLCVIDTTHFPSEPSTEEKWVDYIWRIFCLGVAFGMRKPLIHCYNTNYTTRIASDIRGKVTFTYKDSEIRDKMLSKLKETFK
jgi:hypothetical protein